MDEIRLIKLIQRNGDRAAADELIRRYYDAILGFVKRQIRDADFALDLTQEIFISCLRSITHYVPKKDATFKALAGKVYETDDIAAIDCTYLALTERQDSGKTVTRFASEHNCGSVAQSVSPNLEDVFLYIYRDEQTVCCGAV